MSTDKLDKIIDAASLHLDPEPTSLMVLELSKDLLPGWKVSGYEVLNKKVFGPKDPRKILLIECESPKGEKRTYSFNYNKILKEMRDKKCQE